MFYSRVARNLVGSREKQCGDDGDDLNTAVGISLPRWSGNAVIVTALAITNTLILWGSSYRYRYCKRSGRGLSIEVHGNWDVNGNRNGNRNILFSWTLHTCVIWGEAKTEAHKPPSFPEKVYAVLRSQNRRCSPVCSGLLCMWGLQ